jgi:hypothetical protein
LSDGDAVGLGTISAAQCSVSPAQGVTGGTSSGTGQSGSATTAPSTGVVSPPVITPGAPTPPATAITTVPTTTTSPQSEPQDLATGTFGVSEGDPVWWVAVEVGADVTSVQMTFPDGASDQMAPVDGIAVLAHKVSAAVASSGTGPDVVRGTLQLLGSGQSVVATVTLPQTSTPIQVPTPVLTPTPLEGGTSSESSGAIVACPGSTTVTPPAQSSGTTEKR